ncbi:MAG: FliO/MopB family protein [Planctomycetes bacterium]|nr:FliO/MopB family protein [Planctomycetota bacterium]
MTANPVRTELRVDPASATADLATPALRGGGFVLVLVALAWSGVRWVRARRGLSATRRLQLVERLAIGPQREIVIVRVDGREVVLGVTGHGIRTVAAAPTPAGSPADSDPDRGDRS